MGTETKVFETDVRVRYQETDQMGVVYHANYLVWFEVGRTSLIRELGYTYSDLEKKGIILPVVEVHANYRAPAHYEDELTIRSYVQEMTGSKLVFGYEVYRESDEKMLTTGHSKHIWCSKEMKRINLEKLYPEIYQVLTKAL
ncbi:acyl-CoA thioesterase [Risungbinella massiliensis]|uniref:acyl-CoA thioesterase n=1 Tax=Risungbinella massiliensis TaxID=1329796 RepID=UPI0005CBE646|nr:thioesterase family protein [Risungbinella massiliensis]